MKYLIILALLLSLCSCSKPEEQSQIPQEKPNIQDEEQEEKLIVKSTNEDAIIYASTQSTIIIYSDLLEQPYTLNKDEKKELIDYINALSYTGLTKEGSIIYGYPVLTLSINGTNHHLFGSYLIKYGTSDNATINQFSDYSLYEYLANTSNITISEDMWNQIKTNQIPLYNIKLNEEEDIERKTILEQIFVENYNKFISNEQANIFSELGNTLSLTPISNMNDWTANYSYNTISAFRKLDNNFSLQYSCNLSNNDNDISCLHSYTINPQYFDEHTTKIEQNSEFAKRFLKMVYQDVIIKNIIIGYPSNIVFTNITEDEYKAIQSEAFMNKSQEPYYLKIEQMYDYPIHSKQDVFNALNQSCTKERSQKYIEELFNEEYKRFIEKEDGIYMNIILRGYAIEGGDFFCDSCYLYKDENTAYVYELRYPNDEFPQYYHYHSLKFTWEDNAWKY